MPLRNVTLEMSLKPFRDTSEDTARCVCRHLFTQWLPLLRHAEAVSVLLWCADGSEILEYRGDLDQPFEWARYIGGANPRSKMPNDPDGIALHSRPYLYMDDPPVFTYRWLKRLIEIIKEEGRAVTGKPVRVGETFDPGPEFARSPFKYERHPEICLGETMGATSFVCSYATLNADSQPYAGFPDGIPQGTPFGTFLGRQCRHFLADLGFDYLWFSNGFGFGLEPWALRGAVFDGQRFSADRVEEVREKSLAFWDLFRAECPDVPLETRGTNLSTAMDLSSDAVPLRDIYRGGYGIEPPPNSPWAALNHDFGLELVGWMSHIAEIPGETFPFRFYTHDPWWLNSPWLDRYGREPHDLYLPLAVSRIDAEGRVRTPTSILFLTADDSYGRLPDQVPEEVIPHLLAARRDEPDQPGPLVWVYPFDEYHDWTFGRPPRIEEVFFGDWLMRGAVNRGFPLNTVISTRSLAAQTAAGVDPFAESLLVSPVPQAGSAWEEPLLTHVDRGGRLLLYGPIAKAGARILRLLNLALADELTGSFDVALDLDQDLVGEEPHATELAHHGLLSGGGICAVPTDPREAGTRVLMTLRQGGETRIGALAREADEAGRGPVVWVRGTVSCDPTQIRGHLLVPLDARRFFPAEVVLRYALSAFGLDLRTEKAGAAQPDPMLCIARHANAFFFSGYSPDCTVRQHLRLPQGAPLMLGLQTRLVAGRATYTMPPAWHRECRVFVEQAEDTLLSCREQPPVAMGLRRRFLVTGLRAATVRFYPEPGTEGKVTFLRSPAYPFIQGDFAEPGLVEDRRGRFLEVAGVTGELLISW